VVVWDEGKGMKGLEIGRNGKGTEGLESGGRDGKAEEGMGKRSGWAGSAYGY